MIPEEQKETLRSALKKTAEEMVEDYVNNKNDKTMSDTVKEKVYCYNHPGMYGGNYCNNDALAIAALASRRNDNDYSNMMWPMMMMGGGMGGWMNNPFAYMMMMRMWGYDQNGNPINGQNAQNIELQNQIQGIRTQLQDNQNTNAVMDAVRGGTSEVARLADRWNCDFNTLNSAVCDVRAAIKEVAGITGFSAEKVINAAERGDMNIITQLKDCCCQTKELVQSMGYQNQLGQKDIISGFQQGFFGLSRDTQAGFDRTNTAIERAASSLGYTLRDQTCELKNNQDANTQRIIDTLNTHWKEELAGKLQKAEFENSQLKQNQYLASLIQGGCGCPQQ